MTDPQYFCLPKLDLRVQNLQKQLRYSATSASLGFIAKVVHDAISHKPYFGGASYISAAFTSGMSNYADMYDICIYQSDG